MHERLVDYAQTLAMVALENAGGALEILKSYGVCGNETINTDSAGGASL